MTLSAAEYLQQVFTRVRPVLVPARFDAERFDATVSRVRPRAERVLEEIFSARPWGGWLTAEERRRLVGYRIQRRSPWPRDPRLVPFSLIEQAKVLSFHYHVETVAKGPETRTLRLFLKNPSVELGTVRLHAFEPAALRLRGTTQGERRSDVVRLVQDAQEHGQIQAPPLEGTIVEILVGGARVLGMFGAVEREVPASEIIVLGEGEEAPDSLQAELLHEFLFGRDTAAYQEKRQRYIRLTGREPEAGRRHEAGPFVALWPTGSGEIMLLGPFDAFDHGIVLRRFGFKSRGDGYVQKATPRNWTKATVTVDKLAAGDTDTPPTKTRSGEVSLPRFGSVAGWLDALPGIRARGERASTRFVEALAAGDFVEAAPSRDLNALANTLAILILLPEASALRKSLVSRISAAQTQAAAIAPGHVGIQDAERLGLWTVGRQGVYVVAQPPTRDIGKSFEPAFQRAGFKRRGGGFGRLVGARGGGQADDREVQLALGLARMVVAPDLDQATSLGIFWADAAHVRGTRNPRRTAATDAAANLKAAKVPAEKALWRSAMARAQEVGGSNAPV